MPNDPNEQGREDRRAEDDPERRLTQIAARRLLGKLACEKFEMLFDQREISSRLTGLSQRQGVFAWHDARYGRVRLAEGKPASPRAQLILDLQMPRGQSPIPA